MANDSIGKKVFELSEDILKTHSKAADDTSATPDNENSKTKPAGGSSAPVTPLRRNSDSNTPDNSKKIIARSTKNVDKKSIKKSPLDISPDNPESFIKTSIEFKAYLQTCLTVLKKKRGITTRFLVSEAIEEKLAKEFPDVLKAAKDEYNIL